MQQTKNNERKLFISNATELLTTRESPEISSSIFLELSAEEYSVTPFTKCGIHRPQIQSKKSN
jgi:hypothetical protein